MSFTEETNIEHVHSMVNGTMETVAIYVDRICIDGIDLRVQQKEYAVREGKAVVESPLIGKFNVDVYNDDACDLTDAQVATIKRLPR